MTQEILNAVSAIQEASQGFSTRLGDAERESTQLKNRLDSLERASNMPPVPGGLKSDAHSRAFVGWLRAPHDETKKRELLDYESKTASGQSGAAGGFLIPEVIAGPLLSRATDQNTLRPIVRTITVSTGDVRLPLSNADSTSGWVGELATRTGTTEPTVTEATPTFGTSYAFVESSEELVMDSLFDIQSWFAQEAGDKLGFAEATAIISGNGSDKPTGMLNTAPEANADGSRTANAFKYLPSGTASTLGAGDAAVQSLLVDMVYDLKAGYRQNARWVMNSKTAGAIRKLTDADNRMIWADSLAQGQPPLLLGYPVTISEAMPDIGADAHPIAFGDFQRGYALCYRGGLRVTLDDNITTPGRMKWYIRRRTGGCTYDNNAVRFLKCATT